MSNHVYARLAGFAWTMVPRAPFRIERIVHESRAVMVCHDALRGKRGARLNFRSAVPVVHLEGEADCLAELLDLTPGPDCDYWRIETSVYSVRWPDGFAVRSIAEPPGFEFDGPERMLIYLQGPFDRGNLPSLADMAAPGQSIEQMGRDWVRLNYWLEGAAWQQTHRRIPHGDDVVVVTSQATQSMRVFADAATDAVGESLTPIGTFLP